MGSFQGRGTASLMMMMMIMIMGLYASDGVLATNYQVGDGKWTIMSYDSWLSGKSFNVGDTLEFVYSGSVHNVVEVSQAEYTSCSQGSNTVHTDGDTKFTLSTPGTHYYICSVPTHCESGMKIAVTAEAASTTPTTPSTTPTTPATTPSTPSTSSPTTTTSPSSTPPPNSSPLSLSSPFFTFLLTLGLSIFFFKA